ncbi:hypothetical protein E4U42_005079 [Claviceps africana]|uniref:Uncharacterized protein n=1 Tax=Claviceps africana TaxID=83212 RepID=A0A8K0NKA9_9HYPO|nr:hypothetical protein E4U42_005079 [Claviceps africana]
MATNEPLPEVAHGASYPQVHQQLHYQPPGASWSPQRTATADSTEPSPQLYRVKTEDYQAYPQVVTDPPTAGQGRGRGGRTILGCLPVVFALSVVAAVLAALVVGLAAGTGVAVNNYRAEQERNRHLRASYASLAANRTRGGAGARPTGTPDFARISNGCSEGNEGTTGTFYRPEFFGKPRFTMYCNKDAANAPVYSLFTADFNTCMSACASWNTHTAATNTSACEAVSFIPLWSDVAAAVKGQAPGDCYLKPGPQSVQRLQTPNIGTECHAALLGNSTGGV